MCQLMCWSRVSRVWLQREWRATLSILINRALEIDGIQLDDTFGAVHRSVMQLAISQPAIARRIHRSVFQVEQDRRRVFRALRCARKFAGGGRIIGLWPAISWRVVNQARVVRQAVAVRRSVGISARPPGPGRSPPQRRAESEIETEETKTAAETAEERAAEREEIVEIIVEI